MDQILKDHQLAKWGGVKADIITIGAIDDTGNIHDFLFDCKGCVTGIEVCVDGSILYGGWTAEELRRMATVDK